MKSSIILIRTAASCLFLFFLISCKNTNVVELVVLGVNHQSPTFSRVQDYTSSRSFIRYVVEARVYNQSRIIIGGGDDSVLNILYGPDPDSTLIVPILHQDTVVNVDTFDIILQLPFFLTKEKYFDIVNSPVSLHIWYRDISSGEEGILETEELSPLRVFHFQTSSNHAADSIRSVQ